MTKIYRIKLEELRKLLSEHDVEDLDDLPRKKELKLQKVTDKEVIKKILKLSEADIIDTVFDSTDNVVWAWSWNGKRFVDLFGHDLVLESSKNYYHIGDDFVVVIPKSDLNKPIPAPTPEE